MAEKAMAWRERWALDPFILLWLLAVGSIAALNLNSAGPGDWSALVAQQLRFAGLGSLGMLVLAYLPPSVFYRGAYFAYAVGLAMLVLVRFAGVEVNHARRWLDLGFFSFQPSELMKICLILGIARYLHRLDEKNKRGSQHLWLPSLMALLPAALILRQPDLSTAVVCVLLALILFVGTQMSARVFAVLGGGAAAAALLAYQFLLEPYQKRRIDVWQAPENYPDSGGYQILQARIAVGHGGWTGQGVGEGSQNRLAFVPYRENDFAFAVLAEEWGFLGSALFLSLYLALFLWSIVVASRCKDRFSAVLALGIGAHIFVHMLLNVGIVLEFLPNTGLPLPLLSYGGTSVITVLLGLGMLMSLSRHRWR